MLKSTVKRRIHEKLQALVQAKAASGFQLVLGYKHETLGIFCEGLADLKDKRAVTPKTWYDLSSLTKILSTVDLLIKAKQEKKISDLDQPLKTWFPFFSSELKNQSLRDVLNHQAALQPIFEYTHELGEELPTREDRIRFFLRKIDETYLPHSESDRKVVYSDVGFMLLGVLVEQVFAKRLRSLSEGRDCLSFGPIVFPLEWMSSLFPFRSLAAIQSLEAKPKWLKGVVQDPRAQWLEGDAGHAGLFGTGLGVENWGRELYLGYHGKSLQLSDKAVRAFIDFENQQGTYLNGFDTPAKEGLSQAGSKSGASTLGHLGYTGCSFWMEIEKGFRVTLLSHRFQPGSDPEILRKLRPGFHDWIFNEVFFRLR
jgi:CubicO group peptidase (beta-lactamase class C family)